MLERDERLRLKALRLNVRLMNVRVAAIAMDQRPAVVTRNHRDFGRLGLTPLFSIEHSSVKAMNPRES